MERVRVECGNRGFWGIESEWDAYLVVDCGRYRWLIGDIDYFLLA